jgi:NAD-dependent deacetylase
MIGNPQQAYPRKASDERPMKIVVLTGARVSAESGLGTFRDAGGLWGRYDLNDVATPGSFARNPALVHYFYNARRQNGLNSLPNAAHTALVMLKKCNPHDLTIVTQNVDDLHERAGATRVIHMHGQLMRGLCGACDARWNAPAIMAPGDPCPSCAAPATRPDVV